MKWVLFEVNQECQCYVLMSTDRLQMGFSLIALSWGDEGGCWQADLPRWKCGRKPVHDNTGYFWPNPDGNCTLWNCHVLIWLVPEVEAVFKLEELQLTANWCRCPTGLLPALYNDDLARMSHHGHLTASLACFNMRGKLWASCLWRGKIESVPVSL